MSEQDQGRMVRFGGKEIPEAEALAAGWNPDNPSAPPSAPDAASNGAGEDDAADSVLTRLRAAYAAGEGEREETIAIAPGRYADLAVKYRPIDWELRRRLQRKAQRTGDTGSEAEATFQAVLVADACKSIMMRPKPGAEYVELHTLIDSYKDGEPIRYDSRLAAILGMELIGGETQGDICRLVFGERAVFDIHMTELTTWSTQILPDDDEDEGGDRPT